ncbi:hypothetical protein [Streptomyces tateyamensis]|uniref:hypothetical protein n=1 Tax=Streptomyces tateyamensis TaxID=565073 RepID=UPI0011B56D39|nr:hypothetical protein [Streptomyces tateyamensis]
MHGLNTDEFAATINELERALPAASTERQRLEGLAAQAAAQEKAIHDALENLRALRDHGIEPVAEDRVNAPDELGTPKAGDVATEADTPAPEPVTTAAQAPAKKTAAKDRKQQTTPATPVKQPAKRAKVASVSTPAPAKKTAETKTAEKKTAEKPTEKKTAAKKTADPKKAAAAKATTAATAPQQPAPAAPATAGRGRRDTGVTLDAVVRVLADVPGFLRAGDVVQALGLDDLPGNTNAVRASLARALEKGLATRGGRGEYAAAGK